MKVIRRFLLFVTLIVLLGGTVVFTSVAEDKPTIHALLVIMDGDPVNFKQYQANERHVKNLLTRVKNKNVCELKLTTLSSDVEEFVETSDFPTPDRVLDWIAALSPRRNDVVLIYYCGHGGRVRGEAEGGTYFDLDGAQLFRKEVVDKLNSPALECRLKILITDTCATETMNIETPEFSSGTSSTASYKAERAYTQLFVQHAGFLHITSATENEYSWGDSTNGGWFTNALVASINSDDDADSRFVGWNEIFEEAEKRVKKFLAENSERVAEKIQHPRKYGEFPKALRTPSALARWANRESSGGTSSQRDDTQGGTRIRKIALSLTEITDEMPLQRLQIHVQFTVEDSSADEVKVQAYFFHQDGKILKDLDSDSEKRYGAVNGQVVTAEQVKVNANKATLSIPISQLHLPRGKKALEIVCVLRALNGNELTRSMKSFEFR